jgi:hypothetical protein
MQKFDREHLKKKLAKLVKAPKIKKYGDARDNPDYSRARCTMPPRTRDGKTHPGGRRLRRALARLESNRKGILECRAVSSKAGGKTKGDTALKMPGAMNP